MAFHPRRYLALAIKEFRQLRKNRRLVVQLIIPPTVALLIFGFALNPEVKGLRAGIVDESRTPASREFLAHLTENASFEIAGYYGSAGEAERALRRLELDLAIVVPRDFSRSLARGRTAEVQVWLDAVNANSAGIAASYLLQATNSFNRRTAIQFRPPAAPVRTQSVVLYNPGSIHAWFFVTGVMSVMVFINSALVASALAVREKEFGTIEQLLMSPAQALEVLLAKTTPVLILMIGVLLLAITVSSLAFDLPQRGAWWLLILAGALAAMTGIGIGILVATFSMTQQQAQLLTFLMIPPLVILSGAFSPVETMPAVFRPLSQLDPLRYMVILVRGVMLKGAGLGLLWQPLAALAAFSVLVYGVSAWRFRGQLR